MRSGACNTVVQRPLPNILIADPSFENNSELNNACIASQDGTEHDNNSQSLTRLRECLKSQKVSRKGQECEPSLSASRREAIELDA
jgi:hypothetical protein